MRSVDRVIGGIAGVLGLLCLFEAHRLWMGWQGAGTIPLFLGVVFILSSVGFFLIPSQETGTIQWLNKKETVPIAIIGGSFAIYISIMDWVGYPISTWLFLAVVEKYIFRGRILFVLIWTGVLTIGTYVVFKVYLGAYFPSGFIGI